MNVCKLFKIWHHDSQPNGTQHINKNVTQHSVLGSVTPCVVTLTFNVLSVTILKAVNLSHYTKCRHTDCLIFLQLC